MADLEPLRDDQQAREVMEELGRVELEFVTAITAPIYWIIRVGPGQVRVRNGTAFFLDTGERVFAVTAQHVIEGLRRDRVAGGVVCVQLGIDLRLNLEGRHSIIDEHPGIDIATFQITEAEIAG